MRSTGWLRESTAIGFRGFVVTGAETGKGNIAVSPAPPGWMPLRITFSVAMTGHCIVRNCANQEIRRLRIPMSWSALGTMGAVAHKCFSLVLYSGLLDVFFRRDK
jgi:hypothetical protein